MSAAALEPLASAKPSFLHRLKDVSRWRKSLTDVFVWLMAGTVILLMLERSVPGHPILVTTPSIPEGLYWLDRTATSYRAGEFVTFEFNPKDKVLKERYAPNHVLWHTKQVKATEGYVMHAAADGRLTACSPLIFGKIDCSDAGLPRSLDSKKRPLSAWLAPNTDYILKRDEVWAYGAHEGSLDSRYHGPLLVSELKGKAHPLLTR